MIHEHMSDISGITDMQQALALLASMEAQVAVHKLQARITMEAMLHTRQETMIPALLTPLAEHLKVCRVLLLLAVEPGEALELAFEWVPEGLVSLKAFLPLPELRELGDGRTVLPVRVHDSLWGMLCVENSKGTLDADSLGLLDMVAGILAAAAQRIRAQFHREETQHQLEEAIRAAKNASSAKSDFLSRMSHEIRTPMNVIIGMCRMALRTDDPEKIRHSLNQIDTSAKHLLGLVNDILDVSKIEANKFQLHQEPFHLEHMLMNVSNTVMMRAEERKLRLQILLARGMPQHFVGDEIRLAQVVTNLFTNAIKFSPEGGNIVLSMRELSREGNRSMIEARVRDHGIGMSPEQLSRLFTSFEQADGSITRKYGGTGLGLAICKSIVHMMNGEIFVESELGRGSTFIFTVEMEVAPDQPEEQQGDKQLPSDMRVLLIDDESAACEYFAGIMQNFGITCDLAYTGEQAVEMLRSYNKYNFVFVDWRMPGMDGVETVRAMRSLLGEHVMVIMVSAADLSDIRDEATQAGVHYFITKPLFSSDLYNFIASVLGMNGQQFVAGPEHTLTSVPDLRSLRVLLAEDMEFNREVAMAMLDETGCMTDEAENGKQALEMFAKDPSHYGLILMDMQMPVMDGLEATRAIRALDHPWAKKVPIVAMTANVFQDDVQQCLEAGMDDHIGKPIEDHTLYEKLAFYLRADATRIVAVAPQEVPEEMMDSAEAFLPYICVEDGLTRLRGNKKLYSTLLSSFQRNELYNQVRDFITARAYEQAAQSAHALKGIAANIELGEVNRLIAVAEATLKTGTPPPEPLLDELAAAYARTLELLPQVTCFLSRESA
ncbi:MAG: response regulator [Clostridia bacterium]|nr:response regulator [Clostridia bacterium]